MNAPLLTQDTKRTLAWIAVAVAFLALLKLLAPTLTPFPAWNGCNGTACRACWACS